eukprot:4553674-Pleurochrysis_carterae.AAC.2
MWEAFRNVLLPPVPAANASSGEGMRYGTPCLPFPLRRGDCVQLGEGVQCVPAFTMDSNKYAEELSLRSPCNA